MEQRRLAKIIFGVILFLSVSVVLGVAGYLVKNRPIKITEAPVAVELNELTIKSLENIDYDTEIGTIRFKDGKYRDDPFYAEILADRFASGDLNNDNNKDAAVIYYYTGGGSGSFYFLNAVINKNGNPYPVSRIDLGDRVIVNSVEIMDEKIIIDMVVQGPDDGLCCPSLRKIFEYEFQEDKLIKTREYDYDEIRAIDISAWKTYRNEDYGYELKYPSEFIYINEYKNDGSVSFRKKKISEGWQELQGGGSIYIEDESSDKIDYKNYQGGLDVYLGRDQYDKDTAEEWVDTENRVAVGAPEYSPYIKIENIEVDGAKGLIVRDARVGGNWNPEGKWNFVAIFRHDKYLFRVGYLNSAEEVKEVISTFKFIPKGGKRLDINSIKIGDKAGDFTVESIDTAKGIVKFSGKTAVKGLISISSGRYGVEVFFTVNEEDRGKIPTFVTNDGLPRLLLARAGEDSKELQAIWGKQGANNEVEIEVSGYATFSTSSDTWGSATFVREIIQN